MCVESAARSLCYCTSTMAAWSTWACAGTLSRCPLGVAVCGCVRAVIRYVWLYAYGRPVAGAGAVNVHLSLYYGGMVYMGLRRYAALTRAFFAMGGCPR